MLEDIEKGQIGYFIQIWEGGKPKMDCYSSNEFNQDEFADVFNQFPEVVGYGKFSRDKDDKIHMWQGKIDKEHLEKYISRVKNKNLEIVMN